MDPRQQESDEKSLIRDSLEGLSAADIRKILKEFRLEGGEKDLEIYIEKKKHGKRDEN